MYNPNKSSFTSALPDVALQTTPVSLSALDWVGMSAIELPLVYKEQGKEQQVQTSVGAFVNLVDPGSRGIHMSRLYVLLDQFQELTPAAFDNTLHCFLQTHEGVSTASKLIVNFEVMERRRALVSDNRGWRFYPSSIEAVLQGDKIHYEMTTEVIYSSTCPCSKSLAAHLIYDKFDDDFANQNALDKETVRSWLIENALYATPHSQRSRATVTVTCEQEIEEFSLLKLTDIVEQALQTPVQTAVKREDEQHFALLNGQNPMFCEDAARTVKNALKGLYPKYKLKVEHYESLHAHDAVAYASSDD